LQIKKDLKTNFQNQKAYLNKFTKLLYEVLIIIKKTYRNSYLLLIMNIDLNWHFHFNINILVGIIKN